MDLLDAKDATNISFCEFLPYITTFYIESVCLFVYQILYIAKFWFHYIYDWESW